jgi:hypothetical protein
MSIGFNSRIPSPLLLIQPTHHQVDLMMQYLIGVLAFTPTNLAFALVYWFAAQLYLLTVCYDVRIIQFSKSRHSFNVGM